VFPLGVTLRSHRHWLRLLLTKVTLPLTIRPTCVAAGDQGVTPRRPNLQFDILPGGDFRHASQTSQAASWGYGKRLSPGSGVLPLVLVSLIMPREYGWLCYLQFMVDELMSFMEASER
jgi:hypothetical protein